MSTLGIKEKSEIDRAIKSGILKRTIFEEYSNLFNPTELSKFLASRPSIKKRKQLKLLNYLLITLWIIILFVEIFSILYKMTIEAVAYLIITIYLIARIKNFDGNFYLPSALWALWGLIFIIIEIREFQKELQDSDLYTFIWIISMIYVLIILISLSIRKMAFPYFKYFKPQRDNNGNFTFE